MLANQAAYQAWRRTFNDPSAAYSQQTFQEYLPTYQLLWAYYNNSLFDKYNRTVWESYKQNYNLYRYIRPVRNPVKRLVNFYAGVIYPGLLVEDESELDEGIQSAMPFSKNVSDRVKSAVAQIWQWSNWQAKKAVYVRYGAALGDVFLESVDDLERGKVYINVVWPGFISDLDLDQADNVKSYILQYQSYDDDGPYTFRKEVDQSSFRYYRNDHLYRKIENIYGFTPGVWVPHQCTGTIHGAAAMDGSQEKIDELNNLISQTHDHIKKALQSPTVLATSNPGGIKKLFGQSKRGATSEFDQTKGSDPEDILLFTASADTKASPLLSPLDLTDAQALHDAQMQEIQKDHPELGFFDQLREMSQLTGPAADRIVGDVKAPVYEAMANYDRGNIAALQMCMSIGGLRGYFPSFNLDSFKKGDLYLKFKSRPILTPTRLEIAQEEQAEWNAAGIAVQNAGVPLEWYLKHVKGYTDQQIAELTAVQGAQAAKIEQAQMLASQDFIPAQGQ
jgi:hypothetical protein